MILVKKEFFFWLNVCLLLAYVLMSAFENLNGQIFHLSMGVSKIITHTLVFGGIIVSIVNLFLNPKRRLVPAISLVIFVIALLA